MSDNRMSDTMQTEDTFSASARFNFAAHHLRAATQAARNTYEVAQANATAALGPWFDDMMLWVPVSVVMAGAALEANANELIQDILDGSSLPLTKSRELLLKDLKKENAGNACDKYRRLALLCDKEPQPGMTEWQNAGYLVKFRNALMHFKPAWDHEGIRDSDSNGKIVDYLKTRIQVSRAYNKLDFPYCLMTYGCAKWAVTSVQNFSQRFSTLLGVNDKFASPHLDFTLL